MSAAQPFETIEWKSGKVVILDQLRLPHEEIYHEYDNPQEVADAIRGMILRGAPAIGVAAALGLALAAQHDMGKSLAEARHSLKRWCDIFADTRPTAVNLFWAIEKMKVASELPHKDTHVWAAALLKKANDIRSDDIESCRRIGDNGLPFIGDHARILTHCNAGALATAGWGTALGVVRTAAQNGKKIHVWVDETRPFLQGARLTAWELTKASIPATLITDNMAGHFMSNGEVDLVIVGADRIARNGDTANKIGTYTLSVLAKENKIPFYVAAPLSTIDLTCPDGKAIPIEERSEKEVREFSGKPVAPQNISARHPAFDITPASHITAIITEAGVARPPYGDSLPKLAG